MSNKMGLKKTENRVKVLLVDTITALCRNTLQFNAELVVEGLIGITVDNQEIFLVNINQQLKGKDFDKEKEKEKEKESEKDTPRKHKRSSNDSPEGKGGKRKRGESDFVDLCDDDDGGGGRRRKDDDVVFVRKEREGRGYSGNPTTPSRRQGPGMQQSPRQMQQSQHHQQMMRARMQTSQSAQALRVMSRGRGAKGSGGLVPRGPPPNAPPNAYAANAAAAAAAGGYPNRGRGRAASYSRGGMSSYPMQGTNQQMYAQYSQQVQQQMMGDGASYSNSAMQQQMQQANYPYTNQSYQQQPEPSNQGAYMAHQSASQTIVGMTLTTTTSAGQSGINSNPAATVNNGTTLQISNVQGAQTQNFNNATSTTTSDNFPFETQQKKPTVIQPISMEDDLIPDLTLSSSFDSLMTASRSAPSTAPSAPNTTALTLSVDSNSLQPSELSPPLQTDIPSPQDPSILEGQLKDNPDTADREPAEKEPISIIPQTNLDSNNTAATEGATAGSGAPSAVTKTEKTEAPPTSASGSSITTRSGADKPASQDDLPTLTTKKRRGRPSKSGQNANATQNDGNISQASNSPAASVNSAESVPAVPVEPRSSLRRNAKDEKKALVLGGDSQSDEEALDDSDDGDWVPGTTGSSKSAEGLGIPGKRSKEAGKKFRCEICGKVFAFQTQFQAHMDKHQMEDCGAGAPSTATSSGGSQSTPISTPNTFVCQVCGESYKLPCFYKKHMDHSHPGVGYPDPHQGQQCMTCNPPPPPSLTKQ